jgi:hypothetical protein
MFDRKLEYAAGRIPLEYWSNVLAMAGAACIAVAFISWSVYVLLWGIILAYAGFKLWRVE